MHRRRRLAAGAAAVLISLTAVSACSSEESGDKGGTSTKDASVINVTIKGDTVEPNGKRYDVSLNQKVEFVIDADEAGEIHIHSKPEQEIAYDAGTSTHDVSFDKPGIFAVESHALEKTIVELEVR
ncbi:MULTISPECIES: hypothetical protein [unclassified Nocardioides]|uniref:hypothetical protein n=1 Tax=unclassified Nocardioides TaxID=2615069 RepID=UPI0006F2A9B9|nr:MULTISPECIES: hypothetical protein [unclassified Nocardioides]KQY56468.1 hypothetical protein ASD30_08995 [Nocardioides sp. Root140]KQZ75226.1 hypothetical protein ASD66_02305 [Nocardioides sp. Root151]KRF14305.1 hypothetical protein ASH02_08105 [Nocardioides sp. Soil796]